MVHQQEFRT